jgi:PAS domain S-box-containing protein
MFAAIFALSIALDNPADAISVLFTIPIAVIAIECGAAAGLIAAAAALGLFGVSIAIGDHGVGVLGFVTRGAGFALLGGLLGHYASSLRAANRAVVGREVQLLSIVDNTTAVIYLKDREGQFVLVNRQFEKLFHVARGEVVGKTDQDIFPRYMADAFQANDRRVLKERKVLEFEEVAPQDDGDHTYLSIKFPLFSQGSETPYGICGISTDISARKRVEKDLKDSKERFREILDTCSEAFISMDESGLVTAWNRAAEETFGWPSAKAIGRPVGELIMPERHRSAYQSALQQFRDTGKTQLLNKRLEVSALRRDGHEFPIELTITAARVPGGFRFNAFMHDISDRKALERTNAGAPADGGEEPAPTAANGHERLSG